MPEKYGSRHRWFVLWPVLSCSLTFVHLLASLFYDAPSDAIAQIPELLVSLSYWAFFVFVPPGLLFLGYAFYFDWCRNRVVREKTSRLSASCWLAAIALLSGGIALGFRGALPTTWVTFIEGPVAFGLLPAIVAVFRIARTGIES